MLIPKHLHNSEQLARFSNTRAITYTFLPEVHLRQSESVCVTQKWAYAYLS